MSVIGELCFATISGRGPDGYRDALAAAARRARAGHGVSPGGGSGGQRGSDCRDARRASWPGELDELELDALLVDSLVDVRYLTGFTRQQRAACSWSPTRHDSGSAATAS